jgi:glycosyltransferase involved in cell wall biosynthesis
MSSVSARSPRFSIAIPNFNYGKFLPTTIQSVLDQGDDEVEIVINDNASTDDSVDVARSFADPRVYVHVNPVNVGFAGNLDLAVGHTSGTHVILLSSDDVMFPGALAAYRSILESEHAPSRTVVSSTSNVIDAEGRFVRTRPWSTYGVASDVPDAMWTAQAGRPVLVEDPSRMLRWGMLAMRNPLPLAPTCYPRELWERVGGYGGRRAMNPDKWFHWRLLATAPTVLLVDEPLFGYRVHGGGQINAAARAGAMKFMVDQYAYTYEAGDDLLDAAGISRSELRSAFVRHDGVERALAFLLSGSQREALRYLSFAAAVYPEIAHRDPMWRAASFLARLPSGEKVLKLGRSVGPAVERRVRRSWRAA